MVVVVVGGATAGKLAPGLPATCGARTRACVCVRGPAYKPSRWTDDVQTNPTTISTVKRKARDEGEQHTPDASVGCSHNTSTSRAFSSAACPTEVIRFIPRLTISACSSTVHLNPNVSPSVTAAAATAFGLAVSARSLAQSRAYAVPSGARRHSRVFVRRQTYSDREREIHELLYSAVRPH